MTFPTCSWIPPFSRLSFHLLHAANSTVCYGKYQNPAKHRARHFCWYSFLSFFSIILPSVWIVSMLVLSFSYHFPSFLNDVLFWFRTCLNSELCFWLGSRAGAFIVYPKKRARLGFFSRSPLSRSMFSKRHIVLYYIMLCFIVLYHAIPYYIVLFLWYYIHNIPFGITTLKWGTPGSH